MRDELKDKVGWRIHLFDALVIGLLLCSLGAFAAAIYFSVWRDSYVWVAAWVAISLVFFCATFVAYCSLEASLLGRLPDDVSGPCCRVGQGRSELPRSTS